MASRYEMPWLFYSTAWCFANLMASRKLARSKVRLDGFDVDTVDQMITFLYTHTYHDSVQAGPDGIAGLEAENPGS